MCYSIQSHRLLLQSLDVPALEALLSGKRSAAARLLDCGIPDDLSIDEMPLERRIKQIRADAAEQPWLLRAVVDRASQTMIGHIGFHSPPRPDDLFEIAPDGVELGYSIHPSFRRQGYAKEAAFALMNWAYAEHAQRCFVLSISPRNFASTAMAESMGFARCGSKIDEDDGLEIFFLRRFEQWPDDWRIKGKGERGHH